MYNSSIPDNRQILMASSASLIIRTPLTPLTHCGEQLSPFSMPGLQIQYGALSVGLGRNLPVVWCLKNHGCERETWTLT